MKTSLKLRGMGVGEIILFHTPCTNCLLPLHPTLNVREKIHRSAMSLLQLHAPTLEKTFHIFITWLWPLVFNNLFNNAASNVISNLKQKVSLWKENWTWFIIIRKYLHPCISYTYVIQNCKKCRKVWRTFSIVTWFFSLIWQPLCAWFSRNEMMLATSACVSQLEFHLQYEWTIADILRKNWASALSHFSRGVIILTVCKSGL